MERIWGTPPSLAEIERLARTALRLLPAQFQAELRDVVLQVVDFADDETLAALGLDDPFQLTGLYEGHAISGRAVAPSGALPDRVSLYRAPILDEWIARGDETLEQLVAHVLIHEIGHHFGLSDAEIHALEDSA